MRGIATAVLLAAVAAAGCSESDGPTAPAGVGGTDATALSGGDGQSGLAAVQRGTVAFHSMEKAIAAGYASPVGGHCDATPVGAMGIHSPNQALIQDPSLNPEKPEVLLYMPTGGSNYRLVGVEYLQPVLLRNTATGQVAPWFSSSPWPAEYQVVNATPSLFGQTF